VSDSQQKSSSSTVAIPAEDGERLILGEISPAEFLRIPQEKLYEIAKRGHEMLTTGKLKDALDIFKGLVAASPYDSVFHCNLASTYAHLGQSEDALAEYTEALKFNIGNVDALVGRSELYLRDGKVELALKDIKAAINYDPEMKRDTTKRASVILSRLQQIASENKK
jgi:tetratricopeptide (TPR) repeat protein